MGTSKNWQRQRGPFVSWLRMGKRPSLFRYRTGKQIDRTFEVDLSTDTPYLLVGGVGGQVEAASQLPLSLSLSLPCSPLKEGNARARTGICFFFYRDGCNAFLSIVPDCQVSTVCTICHQGLGVRESLSMQESSAITPYPPSRHLESLKVINPYGVRSTP